MSEILGPSPLELAEAKALAVRQVGRAIDELVTSLLSAGREQGSAEGYVRAVNHVLRSLVPVTEDYLAKQHEESEDLRPVLYGFVEHLDQYLRRLSDHQNYVDGGLGI